jgi:hypothetical protein
MPLMLVVLTQQIATPLLRAASFGDLPNPVHGLLLQREDGNSQAFPLEKIAALPKLTEKTQQKTSGGEQTVEWSGPLLWDILTSSGLVDPAKHGEHSHLILRAMGRDGYVVTIAVAEISPDFAGKPIIVADRLNGSPLPGEALRLIVPGERRAGRSVRDLVRLSIGQ